ncbi:hypothetical protein [Microbacterium soli]|uniref:Uncharacterized protein n=1 Tax=Microbacterium soli TaxID=446075 RepID=A0ABP7NFC1_9MICO
MSTSEEDGKSRLTRRQLREIRLTGSTPVITAEEATAAAVQPTTVLPRAAEPVEIAPVTQVEPVDPHAPLTRRQLRALQQARQVAPGTVDTAAGTDTASVEDVRRMPEQQRAMVSGVPPFATDPSVGTGPSFDSLPGRTPSVAEDDPMPSADQAVPVSIFETRPEQEPEAPAVSETPEPVIAAAPVLVAEPESETQKVAEPSASVVSGVDQSDGPKVGAAFGVGVKPGKAEPASGALFDALLEGDTSTSQHGTSTALIFTPSPEAGSLSGPIAATGEMLVTGTYALPDGLGSQGHARGTTDGREADAVLIDGELAPTSSPTPIAASAAVSTSKPAGEVIRPPAPEKGNKLMLTLAVVAGGLAIVLAATLVIAFTTGVLD